MAMQPKRQQIEARRIAKLAYPYPGCCLCGQTVGVELAHLDHNSANNDRDNLAWLCRHHHWMFDIGLFSIKAVKLRGADGIHRPVVRLPMCDESSDAEAAARHVQRQQL
jgi:hypothetical protein